MTFAFLRSAGRWQRAEWALLALFLLCHLWHLRTQAGQISGFDAGDYLFRVGLTAKGQIDPPLKSSFWAYHPPLAFLFARAMQWIPGVNDVLGIQLLSKTAFLVAFFSIRTTLGRLFLLDRPAAIGFLYLAFSLPLVVHASASLNMDVLVLAYASAALLCAVCLWKRPTPSTGKRFTLAVALVLLLVTALFTKFSGLLIGVVPILVAANGEGTPQARRWSVVAAVGLVLTAIILVSPYYYHRYYLAVGTPFPNVNQWWYAGELQAACVDRDKDRIGFLVGLLKPSAAAHSDTVNNRDLQHVRLIDTWNDLWLKDPTLGTTSIPAMRVGGGYSVMFALLTTLGAITSLRRFLQTNDAASSWNWLGRILLPFGALLCLSLIGFIYQQPIAAYIPGKCIYVLPISWILAYCTASLLPVRESTGRLYQLGSLCGLILVGGFLIVNTLLPIY